MAAGGQVMLDGAAYPVIGGLLGLPDNATLAKAQRLRLALSSAARTHALALERRRRFVPLS